MKIHRFLCFGRHDRSGNAAVVVEDAQLVESERLKFAQQLEANATVFVETDAAGINQEVQRVPTIESEADDRHSRMLEEKTRSLFMTSVFEKHQFATVKVKP